MTGGTIYAALAALFMVLVGAFGWLMRKAGQDSQKVKKEKTNAAFDAIDNEKPDLDSSLDRLRDRGKKTDPS